MSFAAGFLGGMAQGKIGMDDKKMRERELSIMESAVKNGSDLGTGGKGQDPGMSRGPVPEDGGTNAAAKPYTGSISDRPMYAFNYFREKGLPDHVAAGLVGNLMQESGKDINPAAVGDNGNAYGSGQWNGPRMRSYRAFADERGTGHDDFNTQLDYLMHEGATTEKGAWDAIMGTKTAEEAARVASERFWRPGTPMLENRMGYAAAIYGNRPASQSAPPARGASPEMSVSDAAKETKEPADFRWFRKYFGG